MKSMKNTHYLISAECGDDIRIEAFDSNKDAFDEMKRRANALNDSGDISLTSNTASVYNDATMWVSKYRIISLEELTTDPCLNDNIPQEAECQSVTGGDTNRLDI